MTKAFTDEFLCGFDELILPDELSGRFDIIECLSKSEHTETLLLMEKDSARRFVLKCCPKATMLNAVREPELLKGLVHKGLACVEGELETEDTRYILSEYVDGLPLGAYLSEYQIDEAAAVGLILELCDILSYLHSQPTPIIHRDIKPSNIIIRPGDRRVTLIDFDIARKYAEEAAADTYFSGTQKFAPPEQYGFSQTDCRSDLYALGVVLRYTLTGSVDKKIKPQSRGLARIIDKCTAFAPRDRFQSAALLKRALLKHQRQTNKKLVFAIGSALMACLMLVTGFSAGRYTDFFAPETAEPDSAVYSFREPLIGEAARLALGKEAGAPVLRGELREITAISVFGKFVVSTAEEYHALRMEHSLLPEDIGSIEDLSDLMLMENLRELRLIHQPLYDLSPLSGNLRLTYVEIMQCSVLDLSPLVELPLLDALLLYDNKISDFSPLEKMKSLRNLGIGDMMVQSIAALGDLSHINILSLHHSLIKSLDGIERLAGLTSLNIAGTAIKDFSPLEELGYLRELYISADMEPYLDTFSRGDVGVLFMG